MAKKTVATKKRNVKVGANGQLHVHSSFNNIIVCLANEEGQVISWSSAGKMGFRGSKKNTPYAAQMAAEACSKIAFIYIVFQMATNLKVSYRSNFIYCSLRSSSHFAPLTNW